MAKCAALVPLLILAAGCRSNSYVRPSRLSRLTEEFVYTTISFSPAAATGIGLHQYQKQKLDEQLDDFSPANLDRQQHFYEDFQNRLQQLPSDKLVPAERADYAILDDQCSLAILDLKEIHSALHNPTVYVETLGNALFNPLILEYAPKPQRIENIIARLQMVPLYLDQAATNLVSSPAVWTQVAIEENQGNIDLVDKAIRAEVPDNLKDSYAKASRPALDAMRKFQDYLSKSLSARNNFDWRLKQALYTRKFRYQLQAGVEADTVLDQAERELRSVRGRMLELALPLHQGMFPAHKDHADLTGDARENTVIGEVLAKIAGRHSTRESYMDDARKDLDEARAFVQAKHLLTLPANSNLQVIPTPVFMRGIYSVGGFNPAPPLEPQLGAFYWVTPIPDNWPPERVESKLREYNFYKLKLLTIHEAMPGHYVQLQIASDVQPAPRRLLRSIYGNGPYIEGWAQYAEQAMIDAGFLDQSPELALTFAKEDLRVIANAILDIRLQMLDMTEEQALDLMEKQTFQEKEEAEGKLQRAKLSSAQLPTYFVGWRGWLRVREEYKKAQGGGYNLTTFNDTALKQGAVPLPYLGKLL
jgi:uncharacterized protein (DUF885 family)